MHVLFLTGEGGLTVSFLADGVLVILLLAGEGSFGYFILS